MIAAVEPRNVTKTFAEMSKAKLPQVFVRCQQQWKRRRLDLFMPPTAEIGVRASGD